MINSLYLSQPGGTKSFKLQGINFGWQSIIDLYRRECARRADGKAQMVPRMKESYILRDAWMKLNVASAKIMQVFNNPIFMMVLICIHSAGTCTD